MSVYGLAFYVAKTLVPIRLSPLYAYVTAVSWTTIGGVLAAALLVIVMRRRWPAVAAAGVVYVALLLPTLGIFATGPQVVADRYSYLACLGWALVVGGAVAWPWAGARPV